MQRLLLLSCTTVIAILLLQSTAFAQVNLSNGGKLGKSLKDQAIEAVEKKDYPTAITLYKRWLEADPQDKNSWYNLACVYAMSLDTVHALEAIENAAETGFKDAANARLDPDLASLRKQPRFKKAVNTMETMKEGPSGFIRRFAQMKSVGTYIVMLPPDYETSKKEYPLCLILHGSGSSDLGHGMLADTFGREGVIYIAPRAPYPHLGVMLDAGQAGWTNQFPDPIEESNPLYDSVATDYADWIMECAHDAQKNFRVRKGKFFIFGHSQGANMANVCALLHPDEVQSYFADAASLPRKQFLTKANAKKMKEAGVKVWLLHGEQDNVVPLFHTQTVAKLLIDNNVDCTLKTMPGDHTINNAMKNYIREWVDNEVRNH